MHHDLHEIEKGIKTVLDMENVSIDHLSTDMNPYIICPTQSEHEVFDGDDVDGVDYGIYIPTGLFGRDVFIFQEK